MHKHNFLFYCVSPYILIVSSIILSFYFTQTEQQNGIYFLLHFSTPNNLAGNKLSWIIFFGFFTWAYLWLACTKKCHYGPNTSFGLVPKYKGNGELYSISTFTVVATACYFIPHLPVTIYRNANANNGTFNIVALVTCFYLFFKAKRKTTLEQDPYLVANKFPTSFEFFRGMDLHAYILGVNVKQLIITRLGMRMWQILNWLYFLAGIQLKGNFDYGHFANVFLQSVYIYKSIHLESVFFTMIDMTHDRAGFFLLWGCLVWIPAFNCYHSFYLVEHHTAMSLNEAVLVVILGLGAIWLNYDVLRQKRRFRKEIQLEKPIYIWGKKAEYLEIKYFANDDSGKMTNETGYLLISGWWGIARKMNYFWETIAVLIWSWPGFKFGLPFYMYVVYLLGIFIHRTYREDAKCKDKYGKGWDLYCSKVPYRIFPGIF